MQNYIGKENKLTEEHVQRWYDFSVEQVEKFEPELLYYDFEIDKPEFLSKRRELAAYYYNKQQEWNKGVVLNYKYGAFEEGEAVLDVERGQLSGIRSMPWQACTSISNKSWGYIDNDSFKSAENIITTFVDIVSKNGCLLLNVGPKADGTIPWEQQDVLISLVNGFRRMEKPSMVQDLGIYMVRDRQKLAAKHFPRRRTNHLRQRIYALREVRTKRYYMRFH
jgi:alpha-L-fucosidase